MTKLLFPQVQTIIKATKVTDAVVSPFSYAFVKDGFVYACDGGSIFVKLYLKDYDITDEGVENLEGKIFDKETLDIITNTKYKELIFKTDGITCIPKKGKRLTILYSGNTIVSKSNQVTINVYDESNDKYTKIGLYRDLESVIPKVMSVEDYLELPIGERNFLRCNKGSFNMTHFNFELLSKIQKTFSSSKESKNVSFEFFERGGEKQDMEMEKFCKLRLNYLNKYIKYDNIRKLKILFIDNECYDKAKEEFEFDVCASLDIALNNPPNIDYVDNKIIHEFHRYSLDEQIDILMKHKDEYLICLYSMFTYNHYNSLGQLRALINYFNTNDVSGFNIIDCTSTNTLLKGITEIDNDNIKFLENNNIYQINLNNETYSRIM